MLRLLACQIITTAHSPTGKKLRNTMMTGIEGISKRVKTRIAALLTNTLTDAHGMKTILKLAASTTTAISRPTSCAVLVKKALSLKATQSCLFMSF